MLNRRILRVKAMQAIYAQQQCARSNMQIASDAIGEDFLPDLNSMEFQDRALLASQRDQAVRYFTEFQETGIRGFVNESSERIRRSVVNAVGLCRNQTAKEKDRLQINMVKEAEGIYERYLSILAMLKGLQEVANEEKNKKREHSFTDTKTIIIAERLNSNKALAILLADKNIQEAIRKYDSAWSESVLKNWLIVIKADEKFNELIALPKAPGLEADKEFLLAMVRDCIFVNDTINSHLEDIDSNWEENKVVAKSLVSKTIKAIEEDDLLAELLLDLSPNWDDDKEFFIQLYNATLEDDVYLEKYIDENTPNWDGERIAAVDKIILKMAITEMKTFPSIPVKVTINEYIEVAKKYSTPKSRKFINGVLDAVSENLMESGDIKKSGKGLIDNK